MSPLRSYEEAAKANAAGSTHAHLQALFHEVAALSIRLRFLNEEANKSGLPGTAWAVLRHLKQNGPLSVPTIARTRATSRQNIQIIVNRLRTEGYVSLSANPAHRASSLVNLTEKGTMLVDQLGDPETAMSQLVGWAASESEIESAAALLRRIRLLLKGKHQASSERLLPEKKLEQEPEKPAEDSIRGDSELPVNLL
jgi:DNA-binding MarR family transcriptional regulator